MRTHDPTGQKQTQRNCKCEFAAGLIGRFGFNGNIDNDLRGGLTARYHRRV